MIRALSNPAQACHYLIYPLMFKVNQTYVRKKCIFEYLEISNRLKASILHPLHVIKNDKAQNQKHLQNYFYINPFGRYNL